MKYLLWYLAYAIPCFFVAYCSGLRLHGRTDNSAKQGSLAYYKHHYSTGLQMFVHDYFGVYCPWSWSVARKYRIADRRRDLGAQEKHHVILGHITAIDCLDPSKQEAIARHTFISRQRFWGRSFFNFLISPLSGTILIAVMVFHGLRELLKLFGIRFSS